MWFVRRRRRGTSYHQLVYIREGAVAVPSTTPAPTASSPIGAGSAAPTGDGSDDDDDDDDAGGVEDHVGVTGTLTMTGFTCAELDADATGVLEAAIASVLTGVDTERIYLTNENDSADGGCAVDFVIYCDHDSEEGMVSELEAAVTNGALDEAVRSAAADSGVAALEDASVDHVETRALADDESSSVDNSKEHAFQISVVVWVFAGIVGFCLLCNCVFGASAVKTSVEHKNSEPMQQTAAASADDASADTSQDLSFRMGPVNPMRKPPKPTAAVV